jgi:hypothetical protein
MHRPDSAAGALFKRKAPTAPVVRFHPFKDQQYAPLCIS